MGVQGFTTDNPRNIRFTAPELMPTHAGSDGAGVSSVRPTRESDIFSLGILLLQVCSDYLYSCTEQELNPILFHCSSFMDQTN